MSAYPLLFVALSFLFLPTTSVEVAPTAFRSTQCAECAIYIPNAFSPNGDARNDEFLIYPEAACTFNTFAVKLYDRWGNVFFESEDPNFSWDGRVKNQNAPAAVYFYVIQYSLQNAEDTNSETISGDIALLRP